MRDNHAAFMYAFSYAFNCECNIKIRLTGLTGLKLKELKEQNTMQGVMQFSGYSGDCVRGMKRSRYDMMSWSGSSSDSDEQGRSNKRCKQDSPGSEPWWEQAEEMMHMLGTGDFDDLVDSYYTDPPGVQSDWILESVSHDNCDRTWYEIMVNIVPEERRRTFKLFRYIAVLPLSGEEVVGLPMPSKRLAKDIAAEKVRLRLAEMDESNGEETCNVEDVQSVEDNDFFAGGAQLAAIRRSQVSPPTETWSSDSASTDSGIIADAPKAAASKRGCQLYERSYASHLRKCHPRAQEPCYIYAINLTSTKPVPNENRNYSPNLLATKMGFLSSKSLPLLCRFPIVTRAGEMDVDIVAKGSVTLTRSQLDSLHDFHRFVFDEVVFPSGDQLLNFDFDNSPIGLVIIPLDQSYEIDYKMIGRVTNGPSCIDSNDNKELADEQDPTPERFHFNASNYQDAVVTPWYSNRNEYLYVDSVLSKTPSDEFPDGVYTSYEDYFISKYGLAISDMDQHLLKVSGEKQNVNFLLPRRFRSSERSVNMVAEFCTVHTCPASLWKQLVTVPCILHRLNCLLVADELRCQIASDTGIGKQQQQPYANCEWQPMGFHLLPCAADVRPDAHRAAVVDGGSMRFDGPSGWPSDEDGPSPGLVLEACTLASTGEGFDMARMETIGDSFLKLAVSVYVFGQTSSGAWSGEGHMSRMRAKQISNANLHVLGKERNVGSLISAYMFELKDNWQPPCAEMMDSLKGGINRRVQQCVSDKNVADCVEALIGAYLTVSGAKSANKLLEWFALDIVPDHHATFNHDNGFPILATPTIRYYDYEMQVRLSKLRRFEDSVGYYFQNKLLLLDAFSRTSNCYQRLEFLGDSVLDYLVTRYYYEINASYTPADLTDLRSATVNNATFAAIAVRNNFHEYFTHHDAVIGAFVLCQQRNGHSVINDYSRQVVAGQLVACDVDVPKDLGDIFESVAGAIFLDSGMSLDAVWRVFYPLLRQELTRFTEHVPKSPVRALYEKYPTRVKFLPANKLADGRYSITVQIGGVEKRTGVGRSTRTAKCAAAKYALATVVLTR